MTDNSKELAALKAALEARRRGMPTVVPLDAGTGAPCMAWSEYQQAFCTSDIPTDDQVREWWGARWPDAMIGVSCGRVIFAPGYALVHTDLLERAMTGEAERVGDVWVRVSQDVAEKALGRLKPPRSGAPRTETDSRR